MLKNHTLCHYCRDFPEVSERLCIALPGALRKSECKFLSELLIYAHRLFFRLASGSTKLQNIRPTYVKLKVVIYLSLKVLPLVPLLRVLAHDHDVEGGLGRGPAVVELDAEGRRLQAVVAVGHALAVAL